MRMNDRLRKLESRGDPNRDLFAEAFRAAVEFLPETDQLVIQRQPDMRSLRSADPNLWDRFDGALIKASKTVGMHIHADDLLL